MLDASKTVRQAAALPFVFIGGAAEILLVTSRERGRWIVPKGWPIKGMSLARTAAEEAWEEAGVRGRVGSEPVGRFQYFKRLSGGNEVPIDVHVHPLLVTEHSLDWPERGQRRSGWYDIAEAAATVDDAGLARLLGRLAANRAAPLRALARDLAACGAETGGAETGGGGTGGGRAGQTC